MSWPKKIVTCYGRLLGWALTLMVMVLAPGLALAQPVKPPPRYNEFRPTAALNNARSHHTATRVPNIGVLVTGGYVEGEGGMTEMTNTCEIFRPATPVAITGTAQGWTLTGALKDPRAVHTANLLNNGYVLVAGGFNFGYLNTSELYDWKTGTWNYTKGRLKTGRESHTATLLQDGKVLVAGGYNGTLAVKNLRSCELYWPSSQAWGATGNLRTGRENHTATLLPNGNVLAAGGSGANGALKTAELYNPATRKWTATGSLRTARRYHTATLLRDGRVLVVGGIQSFAIPFTPLKTSEIYDPATGKWTATGSLKAGRLGHTATLLPNGRVLVTAGTGAGGAQIATAELYDPATGKWTYTDSLDGERAFHTATVISDGKVLVAAGENQSGELDCAYLYGVGATFIPPIFEALEFK